jgi:diguanylate cyclase (GGDEF)-like protein
MQPSSTQLRQLYPALGNFLKAIALTLDTPQLAMLVRLAAEKPGVINYGGLPRQTLRALVGHQPSDIAVFPEGTLSLQDSCFYGNSSDEVALPLLVGHLQAADRRYALTLYMPGLAQKCLNSQQTALLHTLSQQLVLCLELAHNCTPHQHPGEPASLEPTNKQQNLAFSWPQPTTKLPPNQTISLDNFGTQLQSCLLEKQLNKLLVNYLPHYFPDQAGRLILIDETSNPTVLARWGNYIPPDAIEKQCSFRANRLLKTALDDYLLCRNCPERPDQFQPFICIVLGVFEKKAYVLQLFQKPGLRLSGDQIGLLKQLTEQLPPVMQRLQLLKNLSTKAFEDPLTGLQNRRYLERTLSYLCQDAGPGFEISVILADIDYFKSINDTYGHPAGDAVLKDFSILLKGHVRPKDVVCRYGGEEFCIVLLDTSPEVAIERAEKIRRAIKYLKIEFNGQLLKPISISLGVASFPHHGETPEALITKADKALYWAKNHGRDQSRRIDQIPTEMQPKA